MITNVSNIAAEPELANRLLTSSVSKAPIPGSWRTQSPVPTETAAQSETTEPAPTAHSPELLTQTPQKFPRKTKIIATLGPASENGDVLRRLLEVGVSVFRLDMSHLRHDAAVKLIYAVRSISTELNRPISLLLDTQGPVIRTGDVPGVKVNLPAITEKDWEDIRFGLESGVDWIALSFVREAADVRQLRQFLAAQKKNNINIIAKIESQVALANLDAIIAEADGIMVARGDLGIECPFEEMPIIQRRIVKKCVADRKPVIVATHLLESMISNPLPTRSEITDVANAIYEQADAVMLSGETSVGQYPVKCVEVLDRIARRIELSDNIGFQQKIILASERDDLVASAVHLADQTMADGIAVFTRQGNLANLSAALRPRWSPVFAFTPDARLARRLRLRYALEPLVLPFSDQPKETIHAAEKLLLERKFLHPGAKVVFITDILDQGKRVSSVLVRTLGGKFRTG